MTLSRKFTRIADEMRDRAGVTLPVAVKACKGSAFSENTSATYGGLRKGIHRIRIRKAFRRDYDVLRSILFHELVHADQAERIGCKRFMEDYDIRTATTYHLPWEKNEYEREAWNRTVDAFPEVGPSKTAHLYRHRRVRQGKA